MMKQLDSLNTDFDQWFDTMKDMAKDDPEGFERIRQQMIDELIDDAPEANRRRLIGLQWRVDQERLLARTPMGACIRISNMMWESVTGEGGLLEQLNRVSDFRRF
ncbi:MAG TPA: DUF3135 domain-containing protein [Thiotrichales bacterium]|nr:DUF3135 domain-containing protein [Thiotrichales bacterium]